MHPSSFSKMQKEENEKMAADLVERKDAEEEAERSSTMRGFFGPLTKNKRLDAISQSQKKSAAASASPGQMKIDEFTQVKKWPPQSEQQLEFDTVLTLSLALMNLPFHIIGSDGFKMLMNYLCPRANLKNPTTLAKFKLPMVYKNLRNDVKRQVEKDIPHCNLAAFTTDGWTARNGDPFVSLTLHYVTSDFELKKLSLDCMNFIGRHTGVLLGKGLDSMISR